MAIPAFISKPGSCIGLLLPGCLDSIDGGNNILNVLPLAIIFTLYTDVCAPAAALTILDCATLAGITKGLLTVPV